MRGRFVKWGVGIGAGLLLAGAIPAQGPSAVQAAPGVRVARKTVTPKRLPSSGGTVFVSVTLAGKVNSVELVRAQGQVPGSGGGPIVALFRNGKRFSGNVTVPPNYAQQTVKGAIRLFITVGGQVQDRPAGIVSLGPSDNSLPPPPPPKT